MPSPEPWALETRPRGGMQLLLLVIVTATGVQWVGLGIRHCAKCTPCKADLLLQPTPALSFQQTSRCKPPGFRLSNMDLAHWGP